MTKGGTVAKSKYAMLEAVITVEPTHIETQKNRATKSAKKRGTSSKTDESDKRFRAVAFCRRVPLLPGRRFLKDGKLVELRAPR